MKKTSLCSSRITGTGSVFPKKIMTNDEISKLVDTNNEWILERTGIRERRIAEPGNLQETNSAMSARASLLALDMAGKTAADVDLIVYATCTPDTLVPSASSYLQHLIGAKNAGVMDVNAACSGFLYALTTADMFVRAGQKKCVLVIGAEVLSSYVNWKDRGSCILFGDGAGAVVVERTEYENPSRIYSSHLGADGQFTDLIICPAGGSKQPVTPEVIESGSHKITLKGREVFKVAVKTLADYATEALDSNGFSISDLDWFIPHQANLRIIEAVANRLDFPMSKTLVNIERYGNTSAATIPTMLDEAIRDGRIKKGHLLVMDVFGAGLTYGSVCLRW